MFPRLFRQHLAANGNFMKRTFTGWIKGSNAL
jgi:hypothetical protein